MRLNNLLSTNLRYSDTSHMTCGAAEPKSTSFSKEKGSVNPIYLLTIYNI